MVEGMFVEDTVYYNATRRIRACALLGESAWENMLGFFAKAKTHPLVGEAASYSADTQFSASQLLEPVGMSFSVCYIQERVSRSIARQECYYTHW
jgi:hypothetical protein